jgi:hypothetical protein
MVKHLGPHWRGRYDVLQVVKVEVDPGEVDALVDRGYLQPKERDDLDALAAAVTTFFSDALVTP